MAVPRKAIFYRIGTRNRAFKSSFFLGFSPMHLGISPRSSPVLRSALAAATWDLDLVRLGLKSLDL